MAKVELRRASPDDAGAYGPGNVTEQVVKETKLDQSDFGEGLVKDSRGHLVQLLWRTGKAYKYDPSTLGKVEA